jgi:peptidoglycan/LPS O-acetylase OafA/YrhL
VNAVGYRPDIDGLRAIAVISVLLFHLGVEAVAGGFLGVDVFFVISGFLITQLIGTQLEQGRFTLREFYLRRARRLLPALLATVALTLAAGCALLGPLYLQGLAASALSANVSASNIYFFRQSGYFDTDALFKPLLHTWSLSVEEQFYLVWPFLLMIGWRWLGPRAALWLALAAGIASLALLQRYRVHTSAIFFLAPFRVFEFAVGASTVWLQRWRPAPWLAETLTLAGLLLIGAAVLGGDPQRSFSDVNLLVPCIGTALVLYAGPARFAGWLLRQRLMVGIGLISYSLYLVHWPLICLVKYQHFDPFDGVEKAGLALAALVLALALFKLIEQPLRHRHRVSDTLSNRRFVAAAVASVVLTSAASFAVWRDGGWLHRYPLSVREQLRPGLIEQHKAYTWVRFEAQTRPFESDARPKVLVVGDSQAADFVNMLGEIGWLASIDVQTVRLDRHCQSLITRSSEQLAALGAQDRATCERYFHHWRELSDLQRADVVVLAFNWYERGIGQLEHAVDALHARSVRQVVVLGRKSQGYSGSDIVQRFGAGPAAEAHSAHHRNVEAWRANERLAAQQRGRFGWIDTMAHVCPSADVCRVFDDAGRILFFDGSHVTPAGARFLGDALLRAGQLDALGGRPPPSSRVGAHDAGDALGEHRAPERIEAR